VRTLSIRLPEPLDRKLDHEARDEGKSRSELAREAIADFIERRERERFLATLAAEAREVRDAPEGRRIAEEFLVAENEALEGSAVADGGGEGDDPDERWWE